MSLKATSGSKGDTLDPSDWSECTESDPYCAAVVLVALKALSEILLKGEATEVGEVVAWSREVQSSTEVPELDAVEMSTIGSSETV